MFGLTKREQRWKAEQKAAETLANLAATAVTAVAQVRIAEEQAKTNAMVAALIEENRRMRAVLELAADINPYGSAVNASVRDKARAIIQGGQA